MKPIRMRTAAALAVAFSTLLIAGVALCGQPEEVEPAPRPVTTMLITPGYVTPVADITPKTPATPAPIFTEEDVTMIAKTIWAEARGVPSADEKAAVAWCILNRVDGPDWPDTIAEVVAQPNQFAYRESSPATEELMLLAADVLCRWQLEKEGAADVGRVLPEEYTFFTGDGERNHFRSTFEDTGAYWDFSNPSPYKEGQH